MMIADAVVVAAAATLAYYLRFEGAVLSVYRGQTAEIGVVALVVYVALLWIFDESTLKTTLLTPRLSEP